MSEVQGSLVLDNYSEEQTGLEGLIIPVLQKYEPYNPRKKHHSYGPGGNKLDPNWFSF